MTTEMARRTRVHVRASRRSARDTRIAFGLAGLAMLACFSVAHVYQAAFEQWVHPTPVVNQTDLDWCPPNATASTRAVCGTQVIQPSGEA